jgi:TRAP-type transport system small permease protein
MRVAKAFDATLLWLTSAALLVMVAVMTGTVILSVFFRYVLNDALSWTDEVARYLMIWIAWIGAGPAIRQGGHIAVDLLVTRLPAPIGRIVTVLGQLAAIAFLGVVLFYSLSLMGRMGMQTTAALGISMQFPYAGMPVGAALMIYHCVIVLFVPVKTPENPPAGAM